MKRRNFLATAGAIAGTSLSPLAVAANSVLTAPTGPRFQLFRTASAAASTASTMWLEFDRWAPAPGSAVLAQFQLGALFYPGKAPVPFNAWTFNRATPYANSTGAAFAAGASTLRALRVDYRLSSSKGAATTSEQCDLTVPLEPGSYVLVGPLASGKAVDLGQYQVKGNSRTLDFAHTTGAARDFDFLTFHVAAL